MTIITTADLGRLSAREFASLLTYQVETRRKGREWRPMFGPFATLGEAIEQADRHATRSVAQIQILDSDGRVR